MIFGEKGGAFSEGLLISEHLAD